MLHASLEVKQQGIADICIRQDQRVFATAGWDGKVRVFHHKKFRPLAVLQVSLIGHTHCTQGHPRLPGISVTSHKLAIQGKAHLPSYWGVPQHDEGLHCMQLTSWFRMPHQQLEPDGLQTRHNILMLPAQMPLLLINLPNAFYEPSLQKRTIPSCSILIEICLCPGMWLQPYCSSCCPAVS